MMQSFITELLSDASLAEFGQYFETSYAKRCEQWAYCYRIGTPVNTNMTIESFHRLLKVVYLESKHNRRIDQLLSVLFKIARDKEFERLIKHEKGKMTHRISEMNKRHRAAITLEDIHNNSETIWQVPSQSLGGSTQYTVQRILQQCDCKIRCSECRVCMHLYSCSCVDYAIHNTACKHIHAVHMKYLQCPPTDDQPLSSDDAMTESQNVPSFQYSPSSRCDTIPRLKNEFRILLDEAQAIVSKTDNSELLKSGLTHIRSCVSVMQSLNSSSNTATKRKQLIPAINIPPNTKIQHQARFRSTKKKRVSINPTLSKPTAVEIEQCTASLLHESHHVEVCAVCFGQQSNEQEDSIHWIQCTTCSTWVHTTCVNISELNMDEDMPYTCPYC